MTSSLEKRISEQLTELRNTLRNADTGCDQGIVPVVIEIEPPCAAGESRFTIKAPIKLDCTDPTVVKQRAASQERFQNVLKDGFREMDRIRKELAVVVRKAMADRASKDTASSPGEPVIDAESADVIAAELAGESNDVPIRETTTADELAAQASA